MNIAEIIQQMAQESAKAFDAAGSANAMGTDTEMGNTQATPVAPVNMPKTAPLSDNPAPKKSIFDKYNNENDGYSYVTQREFMQLMVKRIRSFNTVSELYPVKVCVVASERLYDDYGEQHPEDVAAEVVRAYADKVREDYDYKKKGWRRWSDCWREENNLVGVERNAMSKEIFLKRMRARVTDYARNHKNPDTDTRYSSQVLDVATYQLWETYGEKHYPDEVSDEAIDSVLRAYSKQFSTKYNAWGVGTRVTLSNDDKEKYQQNTQEVRDALKVVDDFKDIPADYIPKTSAVEGGFVDDSYKAPIDLDELGERAFARGAANINVNEVFKNPVRNDNVFTGTEASRALEKVLSQISNTTYRNDMMQDDNAFVDRCSVVSKPEKVTVGGKTFTYHDAIHEITLPVDLIDTSNGEPYMINGQAYDLGTAEYYNVYKIKEAITRQILLKYSDIRSIIIAGNRLIINGYCYRPKLGENIKMHFPMDSKNLIDNGLVADFVLWSMLDRTKIVSLAIDNWNYVNSILADEIHMSGDPDTKIAYMFAYFNNLQSLTIQENTITQPLSQEIKDKLAYESRWDNLYGKFTNTMEEKGTLKLARYSTQCMSNFWNSPKRSVWGVAWRGTGWLLTHAIDLTVRKPVQLIHGITDMIKGK